MKSHFLTLDWRWGCWKHVLSLSKLLSGLPPSLCHTSFSPAHTTMFCLRHTHTALLINCHHLHHVQVFTFIKPHNPLKQELCLPPFTHSRNLQTIPLLCRGFHSRHPRSSKICLWLCKVSSLLLIAEGMPQGSFTNHLSERAIRYRIIGSAPSRMPGTRQPGKVFH